MRNNTILIVCISLLVSGLMLSCSPRVATSMLRITTPEDSLHGPLMTVREGKKVRTVYPVTEWTATESEDTYHKMHHHGVAIESELMAYRIYFDKKHTIDIYAKRRPQLELEACRWYPNDEQLAAGFGDDILRVSGTVGVGSVKPWNGQKMVHIEGIESRTERIVKCTKRKAVMEVEVRGWQTEGKKVDMRVRYTLKAGHRDMLCEVYLSEPLEKLCTGVQLLPGGQEWCETTKDGGVLLGSWGTDWPVNDTVKYGKETVGLGVYIPQKYAVQPVHDKRNNLCLLAGGKTYLRFYLTCVGASKEETPPARTAEEFAEYLRRWGKE